MKQNINFYLGKFGAIFTLIAICLIMPRNLSASENYFVQGTKWHIYHTPVQPYDCFPKWAKSFIWLGDPTEKQGEKCLRLYYQQDFSDIPYAEALTDVIGYIHTDGDKVLFHRPQYSSDWLTMYDFSLQPGGSTEVMAFSYGDGPIMYTVTCEERRPSADYPGMEEMVMKRTNFPWTEGVLREPFSEGEYEYWLVGIGRTTGPYWTIEVAWVGSNMYDSIISVQSNGKTICSINNAEILAKAAIESVAADAQAEPVGYFDLQGRRLSEPAEGAVTIVRLSDGTARKIVR